MTKSKTRHRSEELGGRGLHASRRAATVCNLAIIYWDRLTFHDYVGLLLKFWVFQYGMQEARSKSSKLVIIVIWHTR